MRGIIETEFERFMKDYRNGLKKVKSNNYLDSSHYEDDYTGTEIANAQNTLKLKIEELLVKNKETDFRVYYDWCVHVIHSDFDKMIEKESKRIAESRSNIINKNCDFCSCETLDGFNHDLLNDYSDDVGISAEISNKKVMIEVDLGDRVITKFFNINSCPICRRRL